MMQSLPSLRRSNSSVGTMLRYRRLCMYVRPSVRPSGRPSVRHEKLPETNGRPRRAILSRQTKFTYQLAAKSSWLIPRSNCRNSLFFANAHSIPTECRGINFVCAFVCRHWTFGCRNSARSLVFLTFIFKVKQFKCGCFAVISKPLDREP